MEDNKFDLKMRSILENGTEEVPAGLWSAIEGKLPAAPTKKAVLWWPWVAGSVAAAAAVALTVFFTGTSQPADGTINIINQGGQAMAESLSQETQAESAPAATDNPALSPETTVAKAVASETAASKAVASETAAAKAVASETAAANAADTYFITSANSGMIDGAEMKSSGGNDIAASSQTEGATSEQTERATSEQTEGATSEQTEESANGAPAASKYGTGRFDENGIELDTKTKVRRPAQITFSGDAGTNNSADGKRRADRNMVQKVPVVPSSTGIEESGPSRYTIPVSAGLGVKIPLAERWSVGTGVNWSMMSRTFSGQYNKIDENGAIVSQTSYSDIRNTQNYIGIPVNVYFSIIKRDFIDFYTYAGGSVNKCLSNKYTMKGLSETETYRSSQTGWQYSAGIGLGVEFIAAKRIGFYIDPSLNYWFSDGKAQNIRTHQPLMMGLELGMRIKI